MKPTVVLDTGVLGIVTNPKSAPPAVACRQWVEALTTGGARIIVPEIADYELRRELLRAGKAPGLALLDTLIMQVEYLPLSTPAMRQAAAFWAQARQQGQPTAGDRAIDCDVVLAAQAATLGVTNFIIATTNVRHLSRFVPADVWQNIS